MDIDVDSKRHPLRFLFRVVFFVGLMALAAKMVTKQKREWSGLTESQARARVEGKVEAKLASAVGEEQATAIVDQVITALKDRGLIKPDPVEEAADMPSADKPADVAEDVMDTGEDALDT